MVLEFGPYLGDLIKKRGLTPPAFARKASSSRSYIGNVLRGDRRPALDRIGRWADILELTAGERERFVLLANLVHSPDLVQKYVAEMEQRLARRR